MGLLIGLLSELVEVESLQHQAGLRIVLCLRGCAEVRSSTLPCQRLVYEYCSVACRHHVW